MDFDTAETSLLKFLLIVIAINVDTVSLRHASSFLYIWSIILSRGGIAKISGRRWLGQVGSWFTLSHLLQCDIGWKEVEENDKEIRRLKEHISEMKLHLDPCMNGPSTGH